MCGRSHRKTVYPTQKQGRDVHPERKGLGILSRREECSKSKPGRDTHWEKNAGVLSAEQRSTEAMSITSIGQSFQIFVCRWPVILFLSSHLTDPWVLPKIYIQPFC